MGVSHPSLSVVRRYSKAALTVREVGSKFLSCDLTPVPHVDAPLSIMILCGRLCRAISDTVGGFVRLLLFLDSIHEKDYINGTVVLPRPRGGSNPRPSHKSDGALTSRPRRH
jgi:hypothetical protein